VSEEQAIYPAIDQQSHEPPLDLTPREDAFVTAYIANRFNGAKAARTAGYSARSAAEIAHQNLRKLHIQKAIKERLAAEHMGPDEVLLRLGDQARGTMDDFLTLRSARVATTITKPLADIIADLQNQIAFEEEYAAIAGLAEKELEAHNSQVAAIRRRILRLELRLKHDPKATEDVPGPIVKHLVPEVDLVKARSRGQLHLIKSYNAKDNKIELYDAHAALVDIGKVHKLFTDKVEHTGDPNKPVVVQVIRGVSMDDL
jgi:phage terminase small subunit